MGTCHQCQLWSCQGQGRVSSQQHSSAALQNGPQNPGKTQRLGKDPTATKAGKVSWSPPVSLRAETQTWGWSQEICNSRALLFPPWTEPKSIAFKLDSDKTLGGSALPAASCQRQPGAAHTRLARCLSSARSAQLQEGQKNHSSISLT